MSKYRDAMAEIVKGTFFELIANEFAGLLRKGIGAIVTFGVLTIAAWVVGWLRIRVTVPIWVAMLYSSVLVGGVLLVLRFDRWKRISASTRTIRPYYDLLWCFDAQNKIVEGPFCPNCKLAMTEQPKDRLGDLLVQLDGGTGTPTALVCRECGFQKSYEMSLGFVKQDIEDRIAAEFR